MPTLSGNTVVAHPKTGAPTVLLAGDEIPEWALSQEPGKPGLIGDHLIAETQPADPGDPGDPGDQAPKGNATRDEWAAYATTKGAPEEDTRPVDEGGLKQTELRDKYGK